MSLEVELKAPAPRGIEKKLLSLGAKKKATLEQSDCIYDDKKETLRKKGITLRLREENGKTILTHKSKSLSKKVKAKEETELIVTPSMDLLLRGLGYQPVLKRKKIRTEFSFNGITVSIDKVVGLGTWVEFEMFGSPEKCHKKILETADKLGIPKAKLTTKSYNEMHREKLKKNKR